MLIKAEQKYIRTSPRKIRLIADAIKKMPIQQALDQLKFLPKRAAQPLLKTVKQAIANAENTHKIKADNLRFKYIEILEGPINKRWRAVSRGRAHEIFKRTSHIKVILESKDDLLNEKPNIKNEKHILKNTKI